MTEETLTIPAGAAPLEARLHVPEDAAGIVVFAHGSGSSRHSERNGFVAEALHEAGLGTLLFDLLTLEEAEDRARVFDVDLLAERLLAATEWLRNRPGSANEPIGYFGASTGAAAALRAAAAPGVEARAVVSRGGRPDLAAEDLPNVRTPTLLIAGERDEEVLSLNYDAQRRLGGPNRIVIVPRATHLFAEPGALESVARLARDWFEEHFGGAAP
jgi:putative phosphoribosyl transferase